MCEINFKRLSASLPLITGLLLAVSVSSAAAATPPAKSPPAAAPAPAPAAPSVVLDYGDNTSETLTTKAWKGVIAENYPEAIAYAKHCIDQYTPQALEMQKGLKSLPTKDDASTYWALNDVGTCYLIMGQCLAKMKDTKGATSAYTYLVDKLKYSQCWDPQGWFWQPADAARKELSKLKLEAE